MVHTCKLSSLEADGHCEFEESLDYTVSSRSACAAVRDCLRKLKKDKERKEGRKDEEERQRKLEGCKHLSYFLGQGYMVWLRGTKSGQVGGATEQFIESNLTFYIFIRNRISWQLLGSIRL